MENDAEQVVAQNIDAVPDDIERSRARQVWMDVSMGLFYMMMQHVYPTGQVLVGRALMTLWAINCHALKFLCATIRDDQRVLRFTYQVSEFRGHRG